MLSSIISNRFNGAIAGATLGYLFGVGYQELYSSQAYLQRANSFQECWPYLHSDQSSQPPQLFRQLAIFSETLEGSSDDSAVLPLIGLFKVLEGVVRQQTCDIQDALWLQPLIHRSLHRPIQAVPLLLPIMLFYHDNVIRQQAMMGQLLAQWGKDEEWSRDVLLVGIMLASAMTGQVMKGQPFCQNDTQLFSEFPLDLDIVMPPSSIHLSCTAFLRNPDSYEISVMALMQQILKRQQVMKTSSRQGSLYQGDGPLMSGLLGALLGSHSGLSGLPLAWRYLLSSPTAQSLGWETSRQKLLGWGTKLAAMWCGIRDNQVFSQPPVLPSVQGPRTLSV